MNHWRAQNIHHAYLLPIKWNYMVDCHERTFNYKNYNFIHCENDGNPDHMKRILAWMLNLNDIKEGGETQFIYQNFKTNPKAGNLYIWPAGATHMHKGITAPNEDKYFVSGWFVFK